jgi:hypothetical protein
MFEIEKGIPIKSGTGRFPFEQMEVGDSFLVPDGDCSRQAVSAAIVRQHKRSDKRFVTRAAKDGRRVWRVQ